MEEHQRLDFRLAVEAAAAFIGGVVVVKKVLLLLLSGGLRVVGKALPRKRGRRRLEAREVLCEFSEGLVLPEARRDRGDLGGAREDLQERGDLRLRPDGRREELDGRVLDVVVGRDHAEVQRRHVDVVVDGDALGLFQVADDVLDELREVVGDVAIRRALDVVEVRVLRQPPVVEGPRQIVDGVLLVFDRLRHDLRVHVVVEGPVQLRLHGEGIVEEAPEVLLLRRVAEHRALGALLGTLVV
mmetsp:Transcript_10154/g.33218  ORF Transcript_10154/g.33218 Transcript_10154/m.33218 type:complete len:242 (-) Transcript_10154:1105-1830(-)